MSIPTSPECSAIGIVPDYSFDKVLVQVILCVVGLYRRQLGADNGTGACARKHGVCWAVIVGSGTAGQTCLRLGDSVARSYFDKVTFVDSDGVRCVGDNAERSVCKDL